MCIRVFLYLVGVVFLYYQVTAGEDIYVAELMVESNLTLETAAILSIINQTRELLVMREDETQHAINILETVVTAECEVIGPGFSCNCTKGYIWSNPVCFTFDCCREGTCKASNQVDFFAIVPICIAKTKVRINGSVTLSGSTWAKDKTTLLRGKIEKLNGFEGLNITGEREGNTIADFEVDLSVIFETSRLQSIVEELEMELGATVLVDSLGLVTIEAPTTTLCYLSHPSLTCKSKEMSDEAGWTLSRLNTVSVLNIGSVVEIHPSCADENYPSCTAITLHEVTGEWDGTYQCSFKTGSITHTATAKMTVALLPDTIVLTVNPLTADCSELSPSDSVQVFAKGIIENSTSDLNVVGFYREKQVPLTQTETDDGYFVYTTTVAISCEKSLDAQYIAMDFSNRLQQTKRAKVDIPTIYAGEPFCESEILDGQVWPKTPNMDTVINRTCDEGRVGYRMRSCIDAAWAPVFSSCVNLELSKVLNTAENFRKGLGATQEVAMTIFAGLKNNSLVAGANAQQTPADAMADTSASISILNVMASASERMELNEDVFPDFVSAASSMINESWDGVNVSVREDMSANYLASLEGLVHNVKVNKSNGLNTENLDLEICYGGACRMSVFAANVDLSEQSGIVKTVGVRNLMDKLKNGFHDMKSTALLVSTTISGGNSSNIHIILDFPIEDMSNRPHCVFWNTSVADWADEGCVLNSTSENRTICACNHLTSFSVLMSRHADVLPFLDEITYIGLGVSLCSLLVLLVIEYLVWSAVVKSNLSHFRHTSLVNISVCLLLADCAFLASSFPSILSDTMCLALTVAKHFFFLAMFCWTLCLSVMLVHQLIFVFNPLRKRVFMFFSSIMGYIVPMLMVGSSYVYYKYTEQPYHKKDTCWLTYNRLLDGSIHAFLLPVGAIVFTNIFSMGVVIVTLTKTAVPDGAKTDKDTAKSIMKVVVFLTPVFGITWALGFIVLFLDGDSPARPFFVYAFTILNTLQGFFILLTGCFAEPKVREELLKLIMGNKGGSDNLNSSATTLSKDK